MKTQALRQVLDQHGFDVVFGGRGATRKRPAPRSVYFLSARRDTAGTPKRNGPSCGTCITPTPAGRDDPRIPTVELDRTGYLAIHPHRKHPNCAAVFRCRPPGRAPWRTWILVDDDRSRSSQASSPEWRRVRFRTLGCYPLTGAIESNATTLEEIIAETFNARSSERQGRLIDSDQPGSWKRKNRRATF